MLFELQPIGRFLRGLLKQAFGVAPDSGEPDVKALRLPWAEAELSEFLAQPWA